MNKINNIGLSRELTSCYDFQGFTEQEVWSRIAQKINIIIEHFNYLDTKIENEKANNKAKFEYLLGEGLNESVSKIIIQKISDGTIGELINGTLLKEINDKVDDFQQTFNKQLDDIVQYDLKKFGAKFDGVTDDTIAWEQLRDNISSKGGILKLPIGRTVLSKKIIFDKPLWIDGTYCGLLDDTNGSVIIMKNSGEIVLDGINSSASNFTITGIEGNTGNGINFTGGIPHANNILVIKQGGRGIVIGSETEVKSVNSFFMERIKARENKSDGICVISSQTDTTKFDANAGTIVNSDSCGNGGSAFLFKNCANNIFMNLNAEVGNKKGITFENAMGNTVIQPYLEGSLEYEISFDKTSYQNTISKLRADMDTLTNIIDNGIENTIVGIERSKARFPFINGIYGIKKAIISSPNIGGYFSFNQLGTRDLRIAYEGYDAAVNVDVRGVTQPTTYMFDKIKVGNDIVSMTNVLYAIAIINFDNCTGNYVTAKNMVVQGAKVGDFVQIATDKVHENIIFSAMVTSENIVSVRVANISSSQVDLGDITCRVMVTRME